MMMSFLLGLAQAEWIVIYDGLSASNFPNADTSGWVYRADCDGGGGGCSGIYTFTCDQNPNKYLKLDSSCNRWRNNFEPDFPYFKVRIIAALLFLDQNGSPMRIQVGPNNNLNTVYTQSVTSSVVNYSKSSCINSMANALGQRTVVLERFETTSNLRISFCYDVSQSNKFAGIRHLTISLNQCHWSCRACTAGDEFNQCTSCYTGSPSSGVCPTCPQNQQFIDWSQTSCQQECARGKYSDWNKVCQPSDLISTLATELSTNSYSTHAWIFRADPEYYTIFPMNRIISCDSRSYIGPLQNNEAVEKSFTVSNSRVRFVRLRATFFLVNWNEGTSIPIFINDIQRDRLFRSGGSYFTQMSEKIFDQSSSCGWRVRIEFQFPTSELSLKVRFQGNMQTDIQQQWGVREVFIDEIVCTPNCATCASTTTCEACSGTYLLYRGACVADCPSFSSLTSQACNDFEDEVQDSIYLVKAFYDTTSTSDTEAASIMGVYTNQAGTNFVTGYQLGFLPGRRVFGGPFSWHKAAFTRTFTDLAPHYGYRIIMTIYLGESAGTFSYTFTGFTTATITSATSADSIQNLWGKSSSERVYTIDRIRTDVQGDITVAVQYIGPSSPEDGFAAISDYFLILYKCMPFCNACTSASTCTSWADPGPTFIQVNPLTCNIARYLDKNSSPYICHQCAPGCTTCTSFTTCDSCNSGFYLLEGVCRCADGLYLSETSCLPCHKTCLTCNGNTSSSCFSCNSIQHRVLNKSTCICQKYFEEVVGFEACQPICGDQHTAYGEECDDGNNIPFDGCHLCSYSCPLNCLTCLYGKCATCINGFTYNSTLMACLPACQDLVLVQSEECEGGNSRMQDSCYFCKYQCDAYCNDCSFGNCRSCQIGFILNQAVGRCNPVCGDQLIVHDEQCDDGNLDGTDGCWNCQFQCPQLCMVCHHGICVSCQFGYKLSKNNTCIGICGDLTVQIDEQCDDGNTQSQAGCSQCLWQCQPECTICEYGVCNECQTNGWAFDLVNKRCFPAQNDGIALQLFEECDDASQDPFDGCFQTRYSCNEFCHACVKGLCYQCLPGFREAGEMCLPICGDGKIVGNEACDDGNLIQMDNCYECLFQCQLQCTSCFYGVCEQCEAGFSLNVRNECQPTCGDGLTSAEVCDDGNSIPLDGCSQCNLECQEDCDLCIFSLCVRCKPGWELNLDGKCETICGDRVRTREESCDDGNSISFDGCNQCQLQCQDECILCIYGLCLSCDKGFQLIAGQCFPSCGLALLIQPQSCLDSDLGPFDSCFVCQPVCDDFCINCLLGQCLRCDQELGYYLNEITNKCESMCGDHYVSFDEQCDDQDNNQLFDGCHHCQFSCDRNCETCRFGVCTNCQNGYYLNDGRCISFCGDLIQVQAEQCDNGELSCLNCTYVCQLECLFCVFGRCQFCHEAQGWYLNNLTGECESKCGDQIVSLQEECEDQTSEYGNCYNCEWSIIKNCKSTFMGICKECNIGFFLEINGNSCSPLCGDGLVIESEKCDDGNSSMNDGCFLCQLTCDFFCLSCLTGVCYKCIEGFFLDGQNQCQSICADGVVSIVEECDDGNTMLSDGCYSCRYQCQEPCLSCHLGRCLTCAAGWRINEYDSQCSASLQDGIAQYPSEQCDDANLQPFDGCFQSNYSCSEFCMFCVMGSCEMCQSGYLLDEFANCSPICGDSLVQFPQQCDDGMNDQSQDGCFQCTFNCDPHCEVCNYGECLACSKGYLLSQLKCVNLCGDEHLATNEQCEDGNLQPFDSCFLCQYSCQEYCEECVRGLCQKCKTGFYLNELSKICETRCGDLIISAIEQCDDGNQAANDGCDTCLYSCQSTCTFCLFGKCQACSDGFLLSENSTCIPICGDEIAVGLENCDDGNLTPEDGCFNCSFSCQPGCSECVLGQCIACKELQGYYLQDGTCLTLCGDNIIAGPEQCEDSNLMKYDGCIDCRYSCTENCKVCELKGVCINCESGFLLDPIVLRCIPQCRALVRKNDCCLHIDSELVNSFYDKCAFNCQSSCLECVNGQCLMCDEQNGWYLDEVTFVCKSICGDQIVAENEECDDGNLLKDDGCFECVLQCQQDCSLCEYGICQQCKPGFYLGELRVCLSNCGDGLVSGVEVCDDENDILYDGCYECQYSCQPSCLLCAQGICYECEAKGWELDSVLGACQPICGDLLVVGLEQCDDGNLTPYDGCFECQLQCQLVCTQCLGGECRECNTPGWELKGIMCQEVCGDGLVVGNEHCEDSNLTPFDGCWECKFDCQEPCEWCNSGACMLCESGWEVIQYYCEPICGDTLVRGVEECDDGNDIPNDGCFKCEYSCDIRCQICGEGFCIECELGWYADRTGVCQPLCGDSIIVSGIEACDDGNDIMGDGCHECEYSCHFACTDCSLGMCLACGTEGWQLYDGSCLERCGDGILVGSEVCDDGNSKPFDGCFDCAYQCHSDCLQCERGVCAKCGPGWYQHESQCKSICGDGIFVNWQEQCDDGNSRSKDGCSEACEIESNWHCESQEDSISICTQSDKPVMFLQVLEADDDYTRLLLNFTVPVKLDRRLPKVSSDYSYILHATILQTFDDQHDIAIEQIQSPTQTPSNVQFEFFIKFKQSIPKVVIEIQLLPHYLVSKYDQEITDLVLQQKLNPSKVISEQEKKRSLQVKGFTTVILLFMGATAGVSLLTGQLNAFSNILDQMQILSYIKYIDIEFPENLDIFLDSFSIVELQPLLKLSGFDKIFSILVDDQEHSCPSHGKFRQDNLNSCFTFNFQSFMFCLSVGYAGYLFSKLILHGFERLGNYHFRKHGVFITRILLKIRQKLSEIREGFHFSGLIKIVEANYLNITFAALMQLSNPRWGSIYEISQIFSAASVVALQSLATVFVFEISQKLISGTSTLNRRSFDVLFDGISTETSSFWGLQYYSVLLAKKLVFMSAITCLQREGTIQTIIVSLSSLTHALFIVILQPLTSRVEACKIVINETIITLTTLSFVFYDFSQEIKMTYNEQVLFGWVHVAAYGASLCSTLILDLAVQSHQLYKKFKKSSRRKSNEQESSRSGRSKEAPVPQLFY